MLERFIHNRFTFFGSLFLVFLALTGCASHPAAQLAQPSNKPESGQTASPSTAVPAPSSISSAAPTSNTTTATAPAVGVLTGTVSFAKDIQPILQNSCVSCHGGDRTSRGLDVKTYQSLMAGSQNGAVVIPGDAGNSLLIQSIQSGQMPKRGSPLPDNQIALLTQWINAGAKNN